MKEINKLAFFFLFGNKDIEEPALVPNEPRIQTLDFITIMMPDPTRVSYHMWPH